MSYFSLYFFLIIRYQKLPLFQSLPHPTPTTHCFLQRWQDCMFPHSPLILHGNKWGSCHQLQHTIFHCSKQGMVGFNLSEINVVQFWDLQVIGALFFLPVSIVYFTAVSHPSLYGIVQSYSVFWYGWRLSLHICFWLHCCLRGRFLRGENSDTFSNILKL